MHAQLRHREQEGSREEIALKLTLMIAALERKDLAGNGDTTRKWLLDTFSECLNATTGHRPYPVAER